MMIEITSYRMMGNDFLCYSCEVPFYRRNLFRQNSLYKLRYYAMKCCEKSQGIIKIKWVGYEDK